MKAKDSELGLTVEELRERFSYDPDTGIFRHIKPSKYQGALKAGDEAGYIREGKYLVISINNRQYYAHRLAWLYVNGEWPPELLDHINQDKLDNRISNLRLASKSENCSNGSLRTNNTSGYKGVVKFGHKWKAQITHNQEVIYLGLHDTPEKAHAAYVKKSKELRGDFHSSG